MYRTFLKNTLLIAIVLILASNIVVNAAPLHTTKVTVQSGEKWWGVFVSQAPLEPFLKPFKVNTADSPLGAFYVPVMLSSAGRYIWSDSPMEIEFDGKVITIGSDHEKVEVVRGGKNLREAYLVCCHKNFPPSGKVPDVNMFAMPQYDTSIELGYLQSQEQVLNYADQILEYKLPAGVLVIGDGWYSTNNPYAFDRELYPDPKEMMDKLHSKGFKVMLTVTPYTQPFGRQYITGLNNGTLLTDADNKPFIVSTYGGLAVCYDMSLPQQVQMVAEGISALKESYPIDGFRFDCRAVMPLISGDKDKTAAFISAWVNLGKGESMCEYLPGVNTPLAPYVGAMENKEGLLATLNDVISAGLTGFPYSHFSSLTTDTTLLFSNDRLMSQQLKFEAAMPIMKIGFAPWRVTDPMLYDAVADAITLRSDIGSYVKTVVAESAITGEPLLRHMEYQFPKSGFSDCNNQFMVGKKYLFVPNPDGKSKLTVRLPRGEWVDRVGKKHKGPRVIQVNCSNNKSVVFDATRY